MVQKWAKKGVQKWAKKWVKNGQKTGFFPEKNMVLSLMFFFMSFFGPKNDIDIIPDSKNWTFFHFFAHF